MAEPITEAQKKIKAEVNIREYIVVGRETYMTRAGGHSRMANSVIHHKRVEGFGQSSYLSEIIE